MGFELTLYSCFNIMRRKQIEHLLTLIEHASTSTLNEQSCSLHTSLSKTTKRNIKKIMLILIQVALFSWFNSKLTHSILIHKFP